PGRSPRHSRARPATAAPAVSHRLARTRAAGRTRGDGLAALPRYRRWRGWWSLVLLLGRTLGVRGVRGATAALDVGPPPAVVPGRGGRCGRCRRGTARTRLAGRLP